MLTRLFASSTLVSVSVAFAFACASSEDPAGTTSTGGVGGTGGVTSDAGDGGGVGGSGGFPTGGSGGATGGASGAAGSGGASGSAGAGGAAGSAGADGGGTGGTAGCSSVSGTPAGLLLYYACEDLAGPTVTDASANANNGTAVGGVTFQQTASLCLGLGFDGTGYVNVGTPASLSNLQKVTVEAWVKRDQATAGYSAGIVAKAGGNGNLDFSLAVRNSDGALYWASASADASYGYRALLSGPGTVGINIWVHVAGTYDSNTNERRFYKNGVEQVATSESFGANLAAPMDGTGPVRIGNYQWDGGSNTDYLDGTIDDVRIWSTVRTPAEICADAGGTFSGSTCTP